MKRNNLIILISIVSVLLMLIGGTYAWFTWSGSENSNIVLTIGDFAGFVKSSTAINVTNLAPVLDYKSTTATSDVLVSGTIDTATYNNGVKTTLTLNITSNTYAGSNSDLKYIVYNKNSGVIVGSGVLNSKTGPVELYTNTTASGTLNLDLRVYIYIDGTTSNNIGLMGKKLVGTLEAKAVSAS